MKPYPFRRTEECYGRVTEVAPMETFRRLRALVMVCTLAAAVTAVLGLRQPPDSGAHDCCPVMVCSPYSCYPVCLACL